MSCTLRMERVPESVPPKKVRYWLELPPTQHASQHQDYSILARESRTKPSFVAGGPRVVDHQGVSPPSCTVAGPGAHRWHTVAFLINLPWKSGFHSHGTVNPSPLNYQSPLIFLPQDDLQRLLESAKETVVNELKSFKPGLIISSGMNLGDCIAVGKGLDIPVMPLYLALMVPSNYIPVLGLLPQLPSFGNMNLIKDFSSKFIRNLGA